jgi:oligopeptidase A
MDEILILRLEMAKILGFEHYAQCSIAAKMVDSTEQVLDFLQDLVQRNIRMIALLIYHRNVDLI